MLSPTLLQIADSAFPTGAFAYSNGLEAMARAGRFQNGESLERYFEAYLSQVISQDIPFLNSAHDASKDLELLGSIIWEWDACIWNDGLRKASLRQGKTFLTLIVESFPHVELDAFRDKVETESWPTHFLPLLAAGLGELDCDLPSAQSLYLHMLMRDQLTAAVRLGLMGPRSAQTVQARLLSVASSRRSEYAEVGHADAWKCAPVVEVGQACHGFLYSRLFQN